MCDREEMDLSFKADLNGWLESECLDKTIHSRLFLDKGLIAPSDDLKPDSLIRSFDLTVEYFNHTPEAMESLHRVVFHAVFNKEDHKEDFDVPRFAVGVDFRVFNHIIKHFNLYKYFYRELWKINHKTAIEFIVKSCQRFTWPVEYIHQIYIKLWHKCTQNNEAVGAGEWLISQLYLESKPEHMFNVIYTFYQCLRENADIANRRPEKRSNMRSSSLALFTTVAKIAEISNVPQQKEVDILSPVYSAIYKLMIEALPINRDNATSFAQLESKQQPQNHIALPFTLCYDLRINNSASTSIQHTSSEEISKSNLDPHEEAFIIIASHLKSKSITTFAKQAYDEALISGIDRLETVIRKAIADTRSDLRHLHKLIDCKIWCCYVLKYRASYWKSVLKLMLQFFDLWNSDIEEAKCADIFVDLIVVEDMLPVLHDHILKHVQLHQLLIDEKPSIEIVGLCRFFLLCLENSKSSAQLIQLRDHAYTISLSSPQMSPAFGSIALWNIPFKERLTRVCNKITTAENTDEDMAEIIPDDILKELLVLSVIWPYEVIRRLVLDGFENRNQYKAIIPLLLKLGHLRNFIVGKHPHPLLFQVIRDVLMDVNQDGLDVNQCKDNIVQFIKYCCVTEFSNNDALIWTPNSLADQSTSILKFKDVLVHLILNSLDNCTQHIEWFLSAEQQSLISKSIIHTTRVNLHLLNAFCESSTKQVANDALWMSHAALGESELPAIFDCLPGVFIQKLSSFMHLRYKSLEMTDSSILGLHIQDWEEALTYINRLTLISQRVLQLNVPSIVAELRYALGILCKDCCWQVQVLWYPLLCSLIEKPLPISHEFFAITGEMDGLVRKANEQESSVPLVQGKGGNTDTSFKGWCDLFIACRSSTAFTDDLFKRTRSSSQWRDHLVSLQTHPLNNKIIRRCFREVLYPATSLAAPTEYANLLRHFLERLYDSCDPSNIIKDHPTNKDHPFIIPFINQLTKEDTKNYLIVLTIVQLLSDQITASSNDPQNKHDVYYVANLVKALQDLVHYKDITKKSNHAPPSYSALKVLISKRRFNRERSNRNNSNYGAESNRRLEEPQITPALPSSPPAIPKQEDTAGPETVYYPPLNTEDAVSNRSLSILTLFHACSLSAKRDHLEARGQRGDYEGLSEADSQQATIYRFLMLILNSLIDKQSRQHFQSLLQTQPKERYNLFKKALKKTGFGVIMRMRPVLTVEEESLLMPVIDRSYHSEHILQVLQSVASEKTQHRPQKKEELYFY